MARTYYVPVGLDLSGLVDGRFVIRGTEWGAITADLEALGDRAVGCWYLGDDLDTDIPFRYPRTLFRLHAPNLGSATRAQVCLRFPNVVVTLDRGRDFVADVKALSSMGITLDVLFDLTSIAREEVGELLDYFLHDRSSRVPLEPFARILSSVLRRSRISLWDLHRRSIDRFVFVDADRKVAGSLDDLASGRTMGTLEDGVEAWRASEPQREIDTFFAALVTSHPECLECARFVVCRGWGVYGRNHCDRWHAILDTLSNAAEEIDALRHALPSRYEAT